MKKYAHSNLSDSLIEMVSEYINDKVIPKIVIDNYNIKNSSVYIDTAKMILHPYHIKNIR